MARRKKAFRRPEDFWAVLEKVKGQEDAKRKLASALSQYTLYLDDPAQRRPALVLSGPSGSGKTFMVEMAARASGLPVTFISSASVSPPSFKGMTLRDVLIQHYLDHRTDKGIIFLDEIDKWCRGAIGTDAESVSTGIRLQAEVLRYLEMDSISFIDDAKDFDELKTVKFNTRNIMWIAAGAFRGLDRMVRARLQNPHVTMGECWKFSEPKDYIAYGMLAELAGRFGTWAATVPLTRLEIMAALREQEIAFWTATFEAVDCKLEIDDGALARCADAGMEQGTGARGAASMLRHCLDDIYMEASRHHLSRVHVDAPLVLTGRMELPSAV